MMQCDTVKELLSDYIDHLLEPNLASQVNDHLKSCVTCGQLVNRVKAITLKLHQVAMVKTSPEFDKNLRLKIMNPGDKTRPVVPIRGMVYGLSGLTAAAAVYFITTTTIFSSDPVQTAPGNIQTRSNPQPVQSINPPPVTNIQPVQENKESINADSLQSRPSPLENRNIQLVDGEK